MSAALSSYPAPRDGIVMQGVEVREFPNRHVNHCCDPNAHERYEAQDIFTVARQPIEAGQEITFDYNI